MVLCTVDINWLRYKQVLLNDRSVYYKPDRELFDKLRMSFKDINIFGFGRYPSTQCWYLIAVSEKFPENSLGSEIVVSMRQMMTWSAPLLSSVQPPIV